MRFYIDNLDFVHISKLEINRKVNEHSKCILSLLLKEDDLVSAAAKYKKLISSPILLKIEENGKTENIFCGFIEKVNLKKIRNIYLDLECFSNSKKEDKEKKFFIYQDVEKKIGDILKLLNIASVSPFFLDKEMENIPIEKPILQNKESNFEFLKKILHDNTNIMPESLKAGNKLWIGNRKGENFKLKADNLELKFQEDSEEIEITLINSFYELGDTIEINSKQYFIIENNIEYKDEICYCTYTLIDEYENFKSDSEAGVKQQKLIGEVLENNDEQLLGRVQVAFKEDKCGNHQNFYWYKSLVPYTTKDTGFYFVPAKKDLVVVEFNEDLEPFIVGSIRYNGHENFKNPNEQYIKNDFGKEINMKEKEINIISLFDNTFISLDEEKIELTNGEAGIHIEKDRIVIQNSKNVIVIEDEIKLQKDDGGKLEISDNLLLKSKSNSKLQLGEGAKIKTNNMEVKASSFKVQANNIKVD